MIVIISVLCYYIDEQKIVFLMIVISVEASDKNTS